MFVCFRNFIKVVTTQNEDLRQYYDWLRARACVRACVRARVCVRACVRACACVRIIIASSAIRGDLFYEIIIIVRTLGTNRGTLYTIRTTSQ